MDQEARDKLITDLTAAIDETERIIETIREGGYEAPVWYFTPSCSDSWVEVHQKDRVLGEPVEMAADDGGPPVALVTTGRSEHLHIVRHDPASVLRRTAADRALLAEYEQARAFYDANRSVPAGEVSGLRTALEILARGYGIDPTT